MNLMKTTLKYILQDKGRDFINTFGDKLSLHMVKSILAVLQCATGELGFNSCFCPDCKVVKRVAFTCKNRLCTKCSRWSNREFAFKFVNNMLPVTHMHITFTIPDVLWAIVHESPKMQKGLIKAAYKSVKDVMELYLGCEVIPGVLCVHHNFGGDLKMNCHIHTIVTEGGIGNGKWKKFTYFPFVKTGKIHTTLNEIWRDNVLDSIKPHLPITLRNLDFVQHMKDKYPDGFYVYA